MYVREVDAFLTDNGQKDAAMEKVQLFFIKKLA